MQVYNRKTGFCKSGGCVLALGSFDALHIGHQALIREAVSQARRRGVRAGVHLFDGRPESVISEKEMYKTMYDSGGKAQIIEQFGADFAYFATFDEAFMRLSGDAFAKMLKDTFDVLCVVVGFHYTFGYKAAGTAETLKEYGKKYGFDVVVIEPVMQDGALVSSTLVRSCLESGNIARANRLLGRAYALRGEVVHDRGVGTGMGIPTANLSLPDSLLLPKQGVYATYSVIDGKAYAGVTNVGIRPTFSLSKVVVETHLLGFAGELSGDVLSVCFMAWLRPERKFNTKEELSRQIFSDMDKARQIFSEMQKKSS